MRYALKTDQEDHNSMYTAEPNRPQGVNKPPKSKGDLTDRIEMGGRTTWHGTSAFLLALILTMKRLIRGSQGKDNIRGVMMSMTLEGAFGYGPFCRVLPSWPMIQICVESFVQRFYTHKAMGISTSENWHQTTAVVVRLLGSEAHVNAVDKKGVKGKV